MDGKSIKEESCSLVYRVNYAFLLPAGGPSGLNKNKGHLHVSSPFSDGEERGGAKEKGKGSERIQVLIPEKAEKGGGRRHPSFLPRKE